MLPSLRRLLWQRLPRGEIKRRPPGKAQAFWLPSLPT
jgi:hypothetical protein